MNGPIVVTGPQRSGTTIAAHILAHDLNRVVVEDYQFNPHDKRTNIVCQNPTALNTYFLIHQFMPGVHFVFIRRDKEDIIASMKRIKWCQQNVNDWEQFLDTYVDHCFRQWERLKEDLPSDCWSELPYTALTSHPLFVHQELRSSFTTKQWQVDQPVGPKYWDDNLHCLQQLLYS